MSLKELTATFYLFYTRGQQEDTNNADLACGKLTSHNNVPFWNETRVENITINTKINRHYITEMFFHFFNLLFLLYWLKGPITRSYWKPEVQNSKSTFLRGSSFSCVAQILKQSSSCSY